MRDFPDTPLPLSDALSQFLALQRTWVLVLLFPGALPVCAVSIDRVECGSSVQSRSAYVDLRLCCFHSRRGMCDRGMSAALRAEGDALHDWPLALAAAGTASVPMKRVCVACDARKPTEKLLHEVQAPAAVHATMNAARCARGRTCTGSSSDVLLFTLEATSSSGCTAGRMFHATFVERARFVQLG